MSLKVSIYLNGCITESIMCWRTYLCVKWRKYVSLALILHGTLGNREIGLSVNIEMIRLSALVYNRALVIQCSSLCLLDDSYCWLWILFVMIRNLMKKKLGSRRQNLEQSKPTSVKQIMITMMFPLHQNLLILQLRCIEIPITALVSCLMFQVIYRIEKVGCCQSESSKHTYMCA